MNNNTKYVKFSNRGDVDSGKALASQPEARKEGDAKMVLDTGLPTSPHLTGAAEGPTPDAAPKVGQGPGVTEADTAIAYDAIWHLARQEPDADELTFLEKRFAAHRHASEQAAVAAVVKEQGLLYAKTMLELNAELVTAQKAVKERDDEIRRLRDALKLIASYDEGTQHGKRGICPYGCDTPHIAQEALQPQTAPSPAQPEQKTP